MIMKEGFNQFEAVNYNSPEGKDVKGRLDFFKKILTPLFSKALHEAWRTPRKKDDGTYEPQIKTTEDQDWIENHAGSNEVDIANTPFPELPQDWQTSNADSMDVALNEIFYAIENGQSLDVAFIEDASVALHDDWLSRNKDNALPEQAVPFSELSEEDQERDRAIIRIALKTYVAYRDNFDWIGGPPESAPIMDDPR